jgi:hypothetical protein
MRKTRISYATPIDALIALAKRLSAREQAHGFSSDIFLDRYQKENWKTPLNFLSGHRITRILSN